MIEEIEFQNFRNLKGKYVFCEKLSVIFGKNNSGKTNILDGIKLAFSVITNDYCKVSKSDFYNSDDSKPIIIKVKFKKAPIKSLFCYDEKKNILSGFITTIKSAPNGRYYKTVSLLNGAPIDYDILRQDNTVPNLYVLPLIRIDDIYTDWLSTGISKFIDSDKKYKDLKDESKKKILKSMETKINKFKEFCSKFNQCFDIQLSEPNIKDEKVFIVNGDKSHDYCIGSGYKSIANIMLNVMEEKYNIILIDEIENHLHPSLIRTLIREIKSFDTNVQIISTTHSPVVVNEISSSELIEVTGTKLSKLSRENIEKIEKFLHPGRSEILFADNIILVEGYTEEMLLNYYLKNSNQNWTIVNVAGVMFEPYIELCKLLHKNVIVISDTDLLLDYGNDNSLKPSDRFFKLQEYCNFNNVKLLKVYNTLESDLYRDGYLNNLANYLLDTKIKNIVIAKNGKKTLIAQELINSNVDLSNWHIIKEIINEPKSN